MITPSAISAALSSLKRTQKRWAALAGGRSSISTPSGSATAVMGASARWCPALRMAGSVTR